MQFCEECVFVLIQTWTNGKWIESEGETDIKPKYQITAIGRSFWEALLSSARSARNSSLQYFSFKMHNYIQCIQYAPFLVFILSKHKNVKQHPRFWCCLSSSFYFKYFLGYKMQWYSLKMTNTASQRWRSFKGLFAQWLAAQLRGKPFCLGFVGERQRMGL